MHPALVICLIDAVKPWVNNYWQMSVDIEQPDDLLSLSGSVDVQTRNASLFYSLQRPLDNLCIDSLPGRKTVVRRSIRGLNDKDVTVLGFCRLCGQGVSPFKFASFHFQ